MKWLDMFSTRFLINIKDQVAGLSYKVPLSDHLTREFIIFQVPAVVMWISVCISRFSQIVLCLVGVKTRHGEGHIYRSIIYRIRVNVTPPPHPPKSERCRRSISFSTLESATATGPETWRRAPVHPQFEDVAISLSLFSGRFRKHIVSKCDYRSPESREGSTNDCWWGMNYCTSREVQSNQLLTFHSEAGA